MATVQETIESGITPIVIELCDVNYFESREKLARTYLTINSLDLGVLTYKQYRMVARRTKQANQLTDRHLQKLFRQIPTLGESRPDISCYIVPVYARLVRDGELVDILLRAMSIYPDAYPAKVCIEITADILFEDMETVKERISQLRSMGFKIAISEVGDRFCPILSLAQLDFDYAFLDESVIASLADPGGEKTAASMISYLKGLEVKAFAPEVIDPEILATLRRIGCDGFAANLPPEEEEEIQPAETEAPSDEIEIAEETEPTVESEPELIIEPEAEPTIEPELEPIIEPAETAEEIPNDPSPVAEENSEELEEIGGAADEG